MRKYELKIVPGPNDKVNLKKMRDIHSETIGGLVTFRGIVIKTTESRPCVQVVCYSCEACGYEAYQTVVSKEFMPLDECPSRRCVQNNVKGKLFIQVRGSKFVSQQEIKLQEPSDQVPVGHVPRSINLLALGSNTKQCSPGDIVTVTGVHMPTPYSGF